MGLVGGETQRLALTQCDGTAPFGQATGLPRQANKGPHGHMPMPGIGPPRPPAGDKAGRGLQGDLPAGAGRFRMAVVSQEMTPGLIFAIGPGPTGAPGGGTHRPDLRLPIPGAGPVEGLPFRDGPVQGHRGPCQVPLRGHGTTTILPVWRLSMKAACASFSCDRG